MALAQFDMKPGEGLVTDMRAVRKDYFLDHDHSAYVDQWDWEQVITAEQRTLAYLTDTVRAIWRVIRSAEELVLDLYPQLRDPRYPSLPDELTFIHAEDLLALYPDLPRKQRETASCRRTPRSSSTGSAGRSPTATRTSCARPTTTTGSPRRSPATAGRGTG